MPTDSERSNSTAERFRRVAGRFTDVARQVPVAAWDAPSPCAGWVARDIVRHMVEWMPSMLPGAGLPILPSADHDPLLAWTTLADALQALLDDPVVAATKIEFGPAGRHTVASGIGMIMLGDIVIHTWDLARTAGLDDTLDADIATEMLHGMQPMDEMLRGSGHYAAKVAVADEARDQDRLIAFTGRDPGWRP